MSRLHNILLLAALFLAAALPAQDLPRRPFLGVQMQPLPEDQAQSLGLKPGEGVTLARVFPNSTAEAAGLKQGDVLLRVGNDVAASPGVVVNAMRNYRAGQTIAFEVWRDKKRQTLKGALKTFPTVQFADFAFEYGALEIKNGMVRTLVTRPPGQGRKPAVLFIQGVGC